MCAEWLEVRMVALGLGRGGRDWAPIFYGAGRRGQSGSADEALRLSNVGNWFQERMFTLSCVFRKPAVTAPQDWRGKNELKEV